MNTPLTPVSQIIQIEFQQEVRAINLAFGKASDFINKSISQRVEAGCLLIALRKNVEERGYNWWDWYRTAGFVRGRKDAERVITLAQDRDPEAAAEQGRSEARERMRRHRETQPRVTANVRGTPFQPKLSPPTEYPGQLIDTLAYSTPASRIAAVTALSSGAQSHRFEQVRDAVADLYTRLVTVGRQ